MRSTADELRERTRAAMARLQPMARVQLALELGERDAEAFASARRISTREARRALARTRNIGRTPSVANAD